jgi:hypothetical protein
LIAIFSASAKKLAIELLDHPDIAIFPAGIEHMAIVLL